MPGSNQSPEWRGIEPALKTQQVLVGAFLAGLLSFTGIVLAMQISGGGGPRTGVPENQLLAAMGLLTLATLVASFVMRRLHVGQLRKQDEQGVEMSEQLLMMWFSTLTILRGALAEGPALFGCVIVMITGNMLGFAGTAVGAIILLAIFPTWEKFAGFVRDVTGENRSI